MSMLFVNRAIIVLSNANHLSINDLNYIIELFAVDLN